MSNDVEDAFARLGTSSYYTNGRTVLLHGDVVQCAQQVQRAGVLVDSIVTSPPFYGMRDYDVPGQLGLEPDPNDYIDRLVQSFSACRALLRDSGSLWVNLGDTYWSGKGASCGVDRKQPARRFGIRPQDRTRPGVWTRPKQLLLLPHRFAIAMQQDGWLVRNDNIWVKTHPLPDPVRDRCSVAHEHLFFFTKSRYYFFAMPPGGMRDTWSLDVSRRSTDHRAAFPERLIQFPIAATTPPHGSVLDPFNGSGTTTLHAQRRGLRSIGFDISEPYCALAAKRLENPAPAC